ncbi:TBC1 domain family member 10B, partial [Ophiophagus hannah]
MISAFHGAFPGEPRHKMLLTQSPPCRISLLKTTQRETIVEVALGKPQKLTVGLGLPGREKTDRQTDRQKGKKEKKGRKEEKETETERKKRKKEGRKEEKERKKQREKEKQRKNERKEGRKKGMICSCPSEP